MPRGGRRAGAGRPRRALVLLPRERGALSGDTAGVAMGTAAAAGWVPRKALNLFWASADPAHGTVRWSLPALLEALDEDQRAIQAVVAVHPSQASRLAQWLIAMTALARERDANRAVLMPGLYYQRLQDLGYDGRLDVESDDGDGD